MTEEDYEKLNSKISSLVEYAKENDTFIYNNIALFYDLADKYYRIINNNNYKEIIFLGPLPNVSEQEIYKLVKEFLSKINSEYAIKFQESLNNNIINYHNPINNEVSYFIANHETSEVCLNIAKEHNLFDAQAMVHEFFHLLNYSPVIERETSSPYIFSEFISIFFEHMFSEFLIEKGYSLYDVELNNQRRREFFDDQIKIMLTYSLFFIFHKNNIEINKENIEKILESEKLQELENNYFTYKNYEINLANIFGYQHLFGTLLANYVYKNGGSFEEKAKKISYINDNVNKMTFSEIFKYLGIKNDENLNKTLVNCYLESERELIGINKI